MKRICIFCGSSSRVPALYLDTARAVGALLAHQGIGVVTGGGGVGLMGAVADGALAAGGEVIGVIPHALMVRELAHEGLSELRVVDTMHERKAEMATLSDAFIALPGGIGTLEELFEVLTWGVLGIHQKACGLLNTDGYYDQLLAFLERSVAEGFLAQEHHAFLVVDGAAEELLSRLRSYTPPAMPRWLDLAST